MSTEDVRWLLMCIPVVVIAYVIGLILQVISVAGMMGKSKRWTRIDKTLAGWKKNPAQPVDIRQPTRESIVESIALSRFLGPNHPEPVVVSTTATGSIVFAWYREWKGLHGEKHDTRQYLELDTNRIELTTYHDGILEKTQDVSWLREVIS